MRRHVWILGLIVTSCAFGSITAGPALGAEYTYKVHGAKLGPGEQQSETLKGKTSQIMSTTVLGTKFEVICKKVKLDVAEEPAVKGGVPGTSVRDKLEFAECEARLGGSRCGEVTLEGEHLTGEIVTIVLPEAKAGELATKLSPSNSEGPFAKLKGCGEFTFTGAVVLLDTPEKLEQLAGILTAKAGVEEITEIKKSNGSKEKVTFKCSGTRASFEGESELALVSDEDWGVF